VNDTSALFALLYVSEMRAPDAAEVARICIQSRANNLRDAISGLLVFDGKAFCQLVEGPAAKITDLRGRLERDPRHRAMRVLRFGLAAQRRFGSWRLGYAFSADPAAIASIRARSDADAVAAFDRWAPGLTLTDEGL
jgi:hypothetical protein